MWTMEKFAVNIRYITQNYQIAIYHCVKMLLYEIDMASICVQTKKKYF